MDSFYKKWLEKNKIENENTKKELQNDLPIGLLNLRESGNPHHSANEASSSQHLSNSSSITTNREMTKPAVENKGAENVLPDIKFENDQMELYVVRTNHVKQIKFRLEDHMYHMKITLKDTASQPPMLRDILNFLESAFNFVLTSIRPLYQTNDHNIAFLTLYQKPMINGLNTGGFDIQEDASEMVNRVLKMLEQFLISNQTLQINETFKVYLKVLSIEHLNFKKYSKMRKHPKRSNFSYKKHYGARTSATKRFNYYWALDVPDSFESEPMKNCFKNKCLVTATVLGLLQNAYFKSDRLDKRFCHVQNINSVNKVKKNHAAKILLRELDHLYENTNLERNGPYELQKTTDILIKVYKCQFFIFDGIDNSNKLIFMNPPNYDDTLQPIYLFQPHEDNNHVVFIRNLNSYFRANVRICFGCKKKFRSHSYHHLCPKIKCCFSCRRFFSTDLTYLHEKLKKDFCDKNTTKEKPFTCFRCNVTCYSQHCFSGHKLLCSGIGTFGFKCLSCNKFTYRHGNISGTDIRNQHQCGEFKMCIFCRELSEKNHLCKLKKEPLPKNETRLAFIEMFHFDTSFLDCLECIKIQSSHGGDQESFFCQEHMNIPTTDVSDEPIIVMIYKEDKEKKGKFTKYELNSFNWRPSLRTTPGILDYSYDESASSTNTVKSTKLSQDFTTNLKLLKSKSTILLSDRVIQLLMSEEWRNTTFISQDEDSIVQVHFALNFTEMYDLNSCENILINIR